jgi:hypothetical protein
MEKLRDTDSSETVKRRARYLIVRLLSRPEVKEYAQGIAQKLETLKERIEDHEIATDERIGSTAEIHYYVERIGEKVSAIARDVVVLVRGDTSDARYKRIFLVSPSEAMRSSIDDRDRFVRNILETLETDRTYASLKSHIKTLRADTEALAALYAQRDTQQLALDRARQELDIATDAVRRAHNHALHHASISFPDDRALVESFFWQAPTKLATVVTNAAPSEETATQGVANPPANDSVPPVRATRRNRGRRRRAA